uniref:Sterile alpha motif domain containing 1 n=1 Tax=Neolamprologus brichardi TaxID=32507 RepID=A0A3Q4G5R8_NEOBR
MQFASLAAETIGAIFASLVKQQRRKKRRTRMSEPNKYREWILETIDSLRSRKARPDLERICRMVRRRHGSDPDRTRTELEKLIQEQTVLKVSYKGSISYRNAAKVQRKSRKKSEFTAAGSSSAEAARERTKHDHLNNNGDSACGATTGCAVGSGCKEEKASAPRDKGLGQQAAGDCPSPGFGHRTGALSGADGGRTAQSKAGAVSAEKECAVSRADTQSKTCPGSVSSVHHNQRQKQSVPLKPKLRVGGGSTKTTGNHANSDLGDRLVASVRSLSEKSLRGGSLTRGKVKVVMEREVARGRLRRTRCGNITLPLRGVVVEEPMPKNASADRLAKSALEEEEREDNEEEEEEEDTRSSEEEGGLSPVQESPQQEQQEGGKGVCTEWLRVLRGSLIKELVIFSRLMKSEGVNGSPVNWTVSDVVSYFTAAGFPEQAAAFRTQEIDGKSLLLMQRNDVLTGLSIRLGPALKIYERHVKVLQKTHFEDDDC